MPLWRAAPINGGLAAAHQAVWCIAMSKPRTSPVSDDGDVRLAISGLVRAVAAASITSTGVILGTASLHLSLGRSVMETPILRSDVYSVGVLVYEAANGAHRSPDSALSIACQRL